MRLQQSDEENNISSSVGNIRDLKIDEDDASSYDESDVIPPTPTEKR